MSDAMQVVSMTKTEYEALDAPDSNTLYLVTDAIGVTAYKGDAKLSADSLTPSAVESVTDDASAFADNAAASATSCLAAQTVTTTAASSAALDAAQANGDRRLAEGARDDAASSAESASGASASAVSARNGAESARAGAESARDYAYAAKAEVVSAKDEAVEAAASAVSASASAVSAGNAAVSAKNDAVSAKVDAVSAKNDAVSARNDAVQAKTDAQTAATSASTDASSAASASAAAVSARNDAVSAKTAAVSSASDAANSANLARSGVDAALNAAQSAADNASVIASYVSVAATSEANAVAAKNEAVTVKEQTEALHDNILTVISIPVGNVRNLSVFTLDNVVSMSWQDPSDNITEEGATIAYWQKTRIVCKHGGFPADETDGETILDSTERDAYRLVSFTYDMGSSSDYHFGIFTCTTGGVWNTGSEAPRFTFNYTGFATVRQLLRAGLPLSTIGLSVGGYLDTQTSTRFKKLRWMLADDDYNGCDIQDTSIRTKRAVFIPRYLPCEATVNDALMLQFDAPENEYAVTWDTLFISGKVYYTYEGGAYTALAENTDWTAGDSVASWTQSHGKDVYGQNHANRKSSGCNSWKESNMRQWLNASGNDWFQKQNEYDVKSANTGYETGFKSGFDQDFLALIMPVYAVTARNTVETAQGGGGGGTDITLDTFWLPSRTEVFGEANNSINEGRHFAFFRDVATTNAQRIQYDEGGTARYCWLRSPYTSHVTNEFYITTSGASHNAHANVAYAFRPAMCIA